MYAVIIKRALGTKQCRRNGISAERLEQDIDNLPDDKYAERKWNEFNCRQYI